MVNTAVTLLVLFLLSACLLLESAHTDKNVENYPPTNSGNSQDDYKIEKIDDAWVVVFSTKDHKSIDLSTKSLQLKFIHALGNGSVISLTLETTDNNGGKLNNHQVRINIVLSTTLVTFAPSSIFQMEELVHSRRLIIHMQTNVELESLVVIDVPPARIKQATHLTNACFFYKEIDKLRIQDQSLVLDVSTPDTFKRTFWNSPLFQPKSLKIDFEPSLELHPLDSPTCSIYNEKVVYDGANPNARFITLMSQKISIMYSIILDPTYFSCRYIRDFRLIGRMIGMAIVNHLPVDMSFTDDLLKALTEEPKHSILSHNVNRFTCRADVQNRALIKALCSGVWKVVPRQLLKSFDVKELRWLITGRPAELININFLMMWAKYEPDMPEGTPLIKWFWTYVSLLNQQDLNTLWKVITGSPRLSSFRIKKYGYGFMIVSKSLQRTCNVPMDSLLPVGIYIGADEPPLLYIPHYSTEQILNENFNLVIKPKTHST